MAFYYVNLNKELVESIFAAKDSQKQQGNDILAIKEIVKAFELRLFAKRTLEYQEFKVYSLMKMLNTNIYINLISEQKIMLQKLKEEIKDMDRKPIKGSKFNFYHQKIDITRLGKNMFALISTIKGFKIYSFRKCCSSKFKTKNLLIN